KKTDQISDQEIRRGTTMKKALIGFVLVATAAAQAQTSKQAVPASTSSAAQPAATTTVSPSTTQTLTTKAPTEPSKFGVNLIVESWANVGSLKEYNDGALINSENSIGLSYKLSDKWKTEFRHKFAAKYAGDEQAMYNDKGEKASSYSL